MIVNYLEEYQSHHGDESYNSASLASYIEKVQEEYEKLNSWQVYIPTSGLGPLVNLHPSIEMQNLILRRYSQSKNNPTSNEEIWRSNIYKLRNVLGPEIMKVGLSEEEREKMVWFRDKTGISELQAIPKARGQHSQKGILFTFPVELKTLKEGVSSDQYSQVEPIISLNMIFPELEELVGDDVEYIKPKILRHLSDEEIADRAIAEAEGREWNS